jgi:hypothetical protein
MQSGTIHSQVQLQMLTAKWEQKKTTTVTSKTQKKEMTQEERLIEQYKEDLANNKKATKKLEIANKIEAGATLTADEINYLRENDPTTLKKYEDLKREAKAYESELRNCRTKEEADRLKMTKVGAALSEVKSISNNPNIPKSQKIGLLSNILARVNHIAQAHESFEKTAYFKNLPSELDPQDTDTQTSQITQDTDTQTSQITQDAQTSQTADTDSTLGQTSQDPVQTPSTDEGAELTLTVDAFTEVYTAVDEALKKLAVPIKRVDVTL